MDIKLVSWNIWGGIYMPAVTEFLKVSQADVIALQEVEESDEYVNSASILADQLDYEYVYARSMEYNNHGVLSYRGNAILSKHHIAGSRSHLLSSSDSRTAMQADIAIGNVVLHAISVHLVGAVNNDPSRQEEQVRTLLDVIPKEHTVIMGDFNAVAESKTIGYLRKTFMDTDADVLPTWCMYPDGPDMPQPDKVVSKYDYIFVSPGMKTHTFEASHTRASDHLPVSVHLSIS